MRRHAHTDSTSDTHADPDPFSDTYAHTIP
jgi:hypothetical protein